MTLTQGASLHETSRWMGHCAINVTAAAYGHLTQDGRERCLLIMDATYGPHVPLVVDTAEDADADTAC